jgi:hypothetical protein
LITGACLGFQYGNPSGAADQQGPQETLERLAGLYFFGDGFVGRTLMLHANGRFSFSWEADDGGYHRDEGTAEIVGGLVSLHSEKSDTNRPGGLPHPKLLPVRWGKRVYLVPDGQVLDFCNAVNLGLEPREGWHGRFYLRMVWTEKVRAGLEEPRLDTAAGLPALPTRWGSYLLKRPLQGKVIRSFRDEEGRRRLSDRLTPGFVFNLEDERALVDLGSDDGLKVGMELFVFTDEKSSAGRPYGIAKVVVVEAHRCTVEVKKPEFFHGFKKHQKVSSRIPNETIEEESVSFWW